MPDLWVSGVHLAREHLRWEPKMQELEAVRAVFYAALGRRAPGLRRVAGR
ncbi:MAG: hypothetical protein ORN83_01545 [Chthoniobacteraceae bacterium]|nr:hypothetical protein [Chthoniobacteraceae bacterium]